MAAPKGMWECPNCGDFVYNDTARCPHCGSTPAGKKSTFSDFKLAMSSQTASKQSSSNFVPHVPQDSDSDTPALWKNIGNKLENLAIWGFVIGVIASIICAIVFGKTVDEYSRYAEPVFSFWLFLLILVGGIAASYLESMFIFAFGRLVNNSERTAKYNEVTAHYMEMQLCKEAEKDAKEA